MSQLLRVQNFCVSTDGFGAGEGQSLERPFGHANPGDLASWAGATASWPNRTEPGGTRGLDDYFTRDMPLGTRLVLGGASVEFQRSFASLLFALFLGILVAYMILASQFNSFLHPVTVLTILPELLRGFKGYRMIVYALVLILVMIFKPSGLCGRYDFSLGSGIDSAGAGSRRCIRSSRWGNRCRPWGPLRERSTSSAMRSGAPGGSARISRGIRPGFSIASCSRSIHLARQPSRPTLL